MTSPFLEAFLRERPGRPLLSANLAVAINETIRLWFEQHADGMQDQTRLLEALTTVMTFQILENPDPQANAEAADRYLSVILHAVKAEGVRRRMGGARVKIVKQ